MIRAGDADAARADDVLELAVRRALRLIRTGRPQAARLALELACYAVDRIERGAAR